MEKKFLNIDELSKYLGVKKSNLYAKVERKEITIYRFGRLIMFKKEEIDAFMETCRIESVDPRKEAKRILKGATNSRLDINTVVENAIEGAKKKEYTSFHGKPDRVKGLRKEVEDGTF